MAEAAPLDDGDLSKKQGIALKRIDQGEIYKQEGNMCYREKNYKKAIGKYHRALLQVKDVDRQDGQQMLQGMMGGVSGVEDQSCQLTATMAERVKELEMSCYNNLAACLLHDTNPNYERVKEYCQNVLKLDEQNRKAWYRQGVALYHLKDYEEAQDCLNRARKKVPKDPDILRYLNLCKEALSKQLQAEKHRYQGMFQKMAEGEEVTEMDDDK